MMNLPHELLPLAGKSDPLDTGRWLPLYLHALDTAGVIRQLARCWLSRSEAQTILPDGDAEALDRLVTLTALVHDIGKLTNVFQRKIEKTITGYRARLERVGLLTAPKPPLDPQKTPHALAGQSILLHLGCRQSVASVVGSHHGKPVPNGYLGADDIERHGDHYYSVKEAEQPCWIHLWELWWDWSLSEAGYPSAEDIPELAQPAQLLLSGLLVMADWISSNQHYFPLISVDETLLTQEEQAARVDRAWQQLNLPGQWEEQVVDFDAECFHDRFGFDPNEMQQAVLTALSQHDNVGLMILEAQMGTGKTEAALAAAEQLNRTGSYSGLFFGLPTQATANGIFPRLLDWGKKQSSGVETAIRLAHGAAELNEDYADLFRGGSVTNDEDEEAVHGLVVHPWFQGRKQAMLANFVVATVDQLLMMALKQKHLMLRHLGLAGKVVIIDECHAYDAYMNTYLERALRWLGSYHTPVILLSATLPIQRRSALVDAYLGTSGGSEAWRTEQHYPLLTWTAGQEVHQCKIPLPKESRRVQIDRLEECEIAGTLADVLSEGGCAGIIVNTVKRAQMLAETLTDLLPDFRVQLYHAQFLMPDRAEREAKLMKQVGKDSKAAKRDRLIVIGTQVLEQSLDLDFDLLITELCPMDLLLQRMGRLHRHKQHDSYRPAKVRSPRCIVLEEELPAGARLIYGDWLLLRTKAALPDWVELPKDIATLVQAVYSETEPVTEEETAAKAEHEKSIQIKQSKADVFRLNVPQTTRRRNRVKTLDGLLDYGAGDSVKAEAAVRDGDPSIDVLVFCRREDGTMHFLPWQEEGQRIPMDEDLGEELARRMARQKLRLPHRFCTPCQIGHTITALEEQTRPFGLWQHSPWLKGELFLLLDEELRGMIGETEVGYRKDSGFWFAEKME